MLFLSEEENKTVKSCLYNINDKINAINLEMRNDRQAKAYLTEKIQSALRDMQVIQHICEEYV